MSKCKIVNCNICDNQEGSSSDTCDICGSHESISTGRWIFYCPKHKQNDWNMAYDNEVSQALDSGDFSNIDGELSEMILDNL